MYFRHPCHQTRSVQMMAPLFETTIAFIFIANIHRNLKGVMPEPKGRDDLHGCVTGMPVTVERT
jgi:hypothetical protein